MNALDGLLVVTLEQAVAAPTASRRLADAGARVIKLERPEGDFARAYDSVADGESAYFIWLNRGKESVVCDLSRAEDRNLFEALIAKADVFIQNLKPGALDRLDFGIEMLRARHPRLITCSISGYGSTGAYADRKAYDLLIQAESGIVGITGSAEEPARVGVSLVDYGTGLNAYEAILEALIKRGTTGVGTHIEVSMFAAMAELMTVPLIYGQFGQPPARVGLKHPSVAPYGVFTCGDGTPILIAVQNDREWRKLAETILGEPEIGTDARFATNIARVENRTQTDGLVQAAIAKHDRAGAATALDRAGIAFGMVNSVGDVLEHSCLGLIDVSHPGGTARVPEPSAQFTSDAFEARAVPALGEHTDAVRSEFLPS